MAAIEHLREVETFQGLGEEILTEIERLAEEKRFTTGERLFKEGDTATHLWVVEEGTIDLRFDLPGRETSEEATLSSVAADKIFGWSSFVPPYKYKLSAYCASDQCRVLAIERNALRDYLTAHPEIGYHVMAAMLQVVGRRFDRLQGTAISAPMAR